MKIKQIEIKDDKLWEVFFDDGTTKKFHSRSEYQNWLKSDRNFNAVETHLRETTLKRNDEHHRGRKNENNNRNR